MLKWPSDHNVALHFIDPGRPMHNANVEFFWGRLRDEFLNEHTFPKIFYDRKAIEEWRRDYNHHRPQSIFDDLTSSAFLEDHFRINPPEQVA